MGSWVGGTTRESYRQAGLERNSKDTLEGSLLELVVWVGAASAVLLDCGKGVGQGLSTAYRFSCLLFPSREPSRVDGTVVGSGSDTDLQSTGREKGPVK